MHTRVIVAHQCTPNGKGRHGRRTEPLQSVVVDETVGTQTLTCFGVWDLRLRVWGVRLRVEGLEFG
jgi:hypothetical protein